MAKVLEGGYVPLLLAIAVYGVMWIWHRGVDRASTTAVIADQVPTEVFVDAVAHPEASSRVPGSAVFLDARQRGHAAGAGLARAEEPLAARTRARPHA